MNIIRLIRAVLPVVAATLTALCLAGSISKPSRIGSFPLPQSGEIQWIGTVVSVDATNRKASVSISSAVQPDGTETYFSQSQTKIFKFEPSSHIHYMNTEHMWVKLSDLKSSKAVVIYSAEQSPARKIIIAQPDPAHKPAAYVIAPNTAGMDPDRVIHDLVTVPIIFPVAGKTNWSDTFLASRGGGTRRHKGQDIFGPKMRALVACFDGKVFLRTGLGNAGHTITIEGDQGWTAEYYHVNNDTPGTDDGKGLWEHAFAPGLKNGHRVVAGQLIGWLGDSGNAESTAPHLHFELWSQELGACYNATASLSKSLKLDRPRVYLPMPDIAIKQSEIRIDGYVREVDQNRNVIVVDVSSTQVYKGQPTAISAPQRRFVKSEQNSNIYFIGANQKIQSQDLMVGDRVTVLAKDAEKGKAVTLRVAYASRLGPTDNSAPARSTQPVARRPAASQSTISIIPADDYLRSVAQTIAETINAARAEKKLPPVAYKPELGRAAQDWSGRMMDRDFFEVRDPGTRESLIEIVGRIGFSSPKPVITSLPSPTAVANEILRSHSDVALSPEMKWIGVGHGYIDDDLGRSRVQHYWTVILSQ